MERIIRMSGRQDTTSSLDVSASSDAGAYVDLWQGDDFVQLSRGQAEELLMFLDIALGDNE